MTMAERLLGEDAAITAMDEFGVFRRKEGLFARPMAWAEKSLDMPAFVWWENYGATTTTLQQLALKVLSQVSSACACERSWSTYDFIHSKKRNCLGSKRAQDLVHVFTNRRLLDKVETIGYQEVAVKWAEEDN